MAKKKQISKIKKKQSVKEFKAWLAGTMEFQPANWVPNIEQWKKIQEMIADLQDEIAVEMSASTHVAHPTPASGTSFMNVPTLQPPASANTTPWRMPSQASLMAGQPAPMASPNGGNMIPLLPEVDGSLPPMIEVLAPSTPNVEMVSSTVKIQGLGPRVKTPDLMDNTKPYVSAFA